MSTTENYEPRPVHFHYGHADTSQISDFDPVAVWRQPCQVSPGIYVCGDLDTQNPQVATGQLAAWVDIGITDVIDLRGEWSDEQFVAQHAPGVSYWWLGTHDNGGHQTLEWFDDGVDIVNKSLTAGGQVLIHCHMGINRAPSMALAALLANGLDVVTALTRIRAARPIANIAYAQDAVVWNGIRNNVPEQIVSEQLKETQLWLNSHPTDVAWVISRIRTAEVAA